MNPQLPAYLQNKARVDLNARATAGMGGVMPPHISIRGNSYTLIDGNGAQQPVGPFMDACVIDILGVMGKRYYENDWTPGSDEPPTCWSTNGVGPSRESVHPQSPTCSECQWNVRGSETSRISNKPIKACRDEKIVALLLPQYPGMLFQLVIPPGSFKNWSGFTKPFENSGMDVSDVLIRFGFQPQVNGVMTFEVSKDQQGNGLYMPEHLVAVFNKALQTKATDTLVGRNDVPIALPAPVAATAVPVTHAGRVYDTAGKEQPLLPDQYIDAQGYIQMKPAAQFGGQPQAQVPFGASAAATNTQPLGNVQPAATPQTEQPRTRTRRTREQIAADNAAKAAAQAGGSPPGQTQVQPQAPFPVNQPGGFGNPLPASGAAVQTRNPSFGPQGQPSDTPTQQVTQTSFGQGSANTASPSNSGSFGIQQGADPNVDPALAAMLRELGQSG